MSQREATRRAWAKAEAVRERLTGDRRNPRADWYDGEPFRPSLMVDDHRAIDTGLVTASGEPIMRTLNPIGFGRDKEWRS